MDEHALALLPHDYNLDGETDEYIEPVADQIVNRKKLESLEQTLSNLRRTSRAQHESVTKLETDMKAAVSAEDLQRALGLTLEEVDERMEEVFKDSNKRLLTMFARRDEVSELQGSVRQKVGVDAHNSVLQKLTDLRAYIDTVTQSVFVNHINAINAEFAKKADAVTVDAALKLKADVTELNDLQARMERLEELFTHSKHEQDTCIKAFQEQTCEDLRRNSEEQKAMINVTASDLAKLHEDLEGTNGVVLRVKGIETRIDNLGAIVFQNREVADRLQSDHKNYVTGGLKSLQDQLANLDGFSSSTHKTLEALLQDSQEFRKIAEESLKDLHGKAAAGKEKQDFLTNATEMLKRKLRELTKSNDGQFKELSEEQERLLQQIAAMERSQKNAAREAARGEAANTHSRRALTPDAREGDGVDGRPPLLEQLQKIAAGSLQQDQALAIGDLQRPPLPWFDADGRPCTQGLDLHSLPRFPSPAPCSARPSSLPGHARHGVTPRSKSARGVRK